MLEELRRYEMDNNPVIGFLEEYGDIDKKPTALVYTDFRMWCERNGHKNIMTNITFSREVCRLRTLKTVVKRDVFYHNQPGRFFEKQ